MKVEKLLRDYRVPYSTPETSNNVGRGWVGVCCPFCDDVSDHLGMEEESGAFKCWRCGPKTAPKAVASLLRIPEREARDVLRRYGWKGKKGRGQERPRAKKPQTKPLALPSGTGELTKRHRQYLSKRGYDPGELEELWGLRSTGPVSRLDGIDYSHRILVPIYWDGRMVSWQTRDATGRAEIKYKACPQEREIIHHQDILYGQPDAEWGRVGIAVEGVTDAWRIGPMAFATFGIEFTNSQVLAIARSFDRVVMMFDPEPQAQEQARKLAKALHAAMIPVQWLEIPCDPGDLDQEQAETIIAPFAQSG